MDIEEHQNAEVWVDISNWGGEFEYFGHFIECPLCETKSQFWSNFCRGCGAQFVPPARVENAMEERPDCKECGQQMSLVDVFLHDDICGICELRMEEPYER